MALFEEQTYRRAFLAGNSSCSALQPDINQILHHATALRAMKRASFYHSISVCNKGTDHWNLGQQGKKKKIKRILLYFFLLARDVYFLCVRDLKTALKGQHAVQPLNFNGK